MATIHFIFLKINLQNKFRDVNKCLMIHLFVCLSPLNNKKESECGDIRKPFVEVSIETENKELPCFVYNYIMIL